MCKQGIYTCRTQYNFDIAYVYAYTYISRGHVFNINYEHLMAHLHVILL